ncbi:MAG: hypothetical protein AAGC93_23210 [Cyanobacteria bacterium P01_F01_bin.53]
MTIQLIPNNFFLPNAEAATKAVVAILPEAPEKTVRAIVGSDADRLRALVLCEAIGQMMHKEDVINPRPVGYTLDQFWDEQLIALKALHAVKRSDAYRVLSLFPMPVAGYQDENYPRDLTWEDFTERDQVASFWLLNMDLELGAGPMLRSSGCGIYENYANLLKKEWDVCEAIHSYFEIGDKFTPSFLWLMSQGSKCINLYRPGHVIHENRPAVFNVNKTRTDTLRSGDLIAVDWKDYDFVQNFHQILEGYAVQLADIDKSFKKQTFKPYLSARRVWAADTRNLKGLKVLTNKKKTGPKPGSKPKKYGVNEIKAVSLTAQKRQVKRKAKVISNKSAKRNAAKGFQP